MESLSTNLGGLTGNPSQRASIGSKGLNPLTIPITQAQAPVKGKKGGNTKSKSKSKGASHREKNRQILFGVEGLNIGGAVPSSNGQIT